MKNLTLFICTIFFGIFTTYSKPAKPVESANIKITAMGISKKYIWVGTDHGLWRIKRSNKSVSHLTMLNSPIPSNHVNCISVDDDGSVWIGTSAGILRFDNFAYFSLNRENLILPDYNIVCISLDNRRNIRLKTRDSGIFLMSQNLKTSRVSKAITHKITDSFYKYSMDKIDVVLLNDTASMKYLIKPDETNPGNAETMNFPAEAIMVCKDHLKGFMLFFQDSCKCQNNCNSAIHKLIRVKNKQDCNMLPKDKIKNRELENTLFELNKCLTLVSRS